MKFYFIFLITILFFGCSTSKNDYELYDNFITTTMQNDFVINDTVLIADKLIPVLSLNNYPLKFDSLNNKNPFYNGMKLFWTDSSIKVLFSESEINFIKKQIAEKEKGILITKNHLFSKNHLIIRKDSILSSDYFFNSDKTKKYFPVYNFTKPVYNQKNDIALFGLKISSNSNIHSTTKLRLIIMKKINKEWKNIGYLEDVGLQH